MQEETTVDHTRQFSFQRNPILSRRNNALIRRYNALITPLNKALLSIKLKRNNALLGRYKALFTDFPLIKLPPETDFLKEDP